MRSQLKRMHMMTSRPPCVHLMNLRVQPNALGESLRLSQLANPIGTASVPRRDRTRSKAKVIMHLTTPSLSMYSLQTNFMLTSTCARFLWMQVATQHLDFIWLEKKVSATTHYVS